jgi:glutaminase
VQAWEPPADAPADGSSRPRRGRPTPVAPGHAPGQQPTGALASPVASMLRRLHARHVGNPGGEVATYIPELARVDPDGFGIAIATVDGSVYEAGDTRTAFTIQSMSKPLTYAAVLDLLGEAAVRRRIGVEPTGDAFNAISLAADSGMPFNPMVNAGAIAAVGMMPDASDSGGPGRPERLVAGIERFAGRPLAVDEAVYRSERDTGHRNRAIAHLLRGTGALDDDPDAVLDAYFRLCSVAVDTRDLALIAATLAAGGRHPITGAVAAGEDTARDVLSVMATCGMYDGAGTWMFEVGLPAKSGVSGGILAVLPGQLGIGVWSPRLDGRGNSVRGVAVCRDLARELDLHLVRGVRPIGAVRTRTSVATRPSKRARTVPERERLTVEAGRSVVLELQGAIGFVAVETLAREAMPDDGGTEDGVNGTAAVTGRVHPRRGDDGTQGGIRSGTDGGTHGTTVGPNVAAAGPAAVVIDLRRATRIDPSVTGLLADLVAGLGMRGSAVAWSGTTEHGAALERVDDALAARRLTPPRRFGELDLALEWAEDVVLSRGDPRAARRPEGRFVPLERHPAMAGLPPEVVTGLRAILERREFRPGEAIVRHGEPADELFLVTGGKLSVSIPIGTLEARRLATLEAGGMVGELAFLGGELRTADVYADTEVEAYVLGAEAFAALAERDPHTTTVFLSTLLRIVAGIARRMTNEVVQLAS